MGQGGGYVLSACHNIQPDVPVENILAMFEHARDYVPRIYDSAAEGGNMPDKLSIERARSAVLIMDYQTDIVGYLGTDRNRS